MSDELFIIKKPDSHGNSKFLICHHVATISINKEFRISEDMVELVDRMFSETPPSYEVRKFDAKQIGITLSGIIEKRPR